MAWTVYTGVIAVVMVITGSINTLSTKWADKLQAVGRLDYASHPFDHPFFQAVGMFIGEMSCMVVFLIIYFVKRMRGNTDFARSCVNPFVFAPPAICDMMGTSLMYVGLTLTYASSFQMLRGAVIIFTALLSVAFLGHTIKPIMWAGIAAVIVGLAIVGLSDIIYPEPGQTKSDTNGIIAGDLLIIMAQIIVAVQMVYEEKFITRYRVDPLQAVGYEGFFGFIFLGILLVPLYYIKSEAFSAHVPEHRLEDPVDALKQMANNRLITLAVIGNIVSIAFFNFAGITITKKLSATTRMVLDSIRTLTIWMVTLGLKWQQFHGLEILGFIFLIIGMCLYNQIIIVPLFRKIQARRNQSRQDAEDEATTPILSQNRPDIQRDANLPA